MISTAKSTSALSSFSSVSPMLEKVRFSAGKIRPCARKQLRPCHKLRPKDLQFKAEVNRKFKSNLKATSKLSPLIKLKLMFGPSRWEMAIMVGLMLLLSACASSITLSPEDCVGRAYWGANWEINHPARYFKIEKKVWAIGKNKTVYWRDLLALEGLNCEQVEKVEAHLRMDASDVLFSLLGLSRQTVELSGTWHNDGILPEKATDQSLGSGRSNLKSRPPPAKQNDVRQIEDQEDEEISAGQADSPPKSDPEVDVTPRDEANNKVDFSANRDTIAGPEGDLSSVGRDAEVLKALDADLDFSGEKNTSSSPAAISAQDGPDNEWPLQPEGMELAHPL